MVTLLKVLFHRDLLQGNLTGSQKLEPLPNFPTSIHVPFMWESPPPPPPPPPPPTTTTTTTTTTTARYSSPWPARPLQYKALIIILFSYWSIPHIICIWFIVIKQICPKSIQKLACERRRILGSRKYVCVRRLVQSSKWPSGKSVRRLACLVIIRIWWQFATLALFQCMPVKRRPFTFSACF